MHPVGADSARCDEVAANLALVRRIELKYLLAVGDVKQGMNAMQRRIIELVSWLNIAIAAGSGATGKRYDEPNLPYCGRHCQRKQRRDSSNNLPQAAGIYSNGRGSEYRHGNGCEVGDETEYKKRAPSKKKPSLPMGREGLLIKGVFIA